jgi:ornithine cyclodeaminase/alanine dehydrogenase-like protein (mu-crystallin family)
MAVLIIGEREVHELLPMRDCIDLMQRTFASLGTGRFVQPPRIIAWQPEGLGAVAAMPAWLGEPRALGAKLISVFPQNRQAGLESHQGLVALFETEHGIPLAVIHAGAITAIRTAAVSGAATRLLANEQAGDLGIFGSGTQARTHLEAMLAVRPIRRVHVWSRSAQHAQTFASEASQRYNLDVRAIENAENVAKASDIICTVTAATAPILKGAWLDRGTHVNAAGSSVPPFRELDTEAVVRARLFVDSRESALREPDDIRVPLAQGAITQDHIIGDLSELASGACDGRISKNDITIFKSVGLAIEDLAAAYLIYERALGAKRGVSIEF